MCKLSKNEVVIVGGGTVCVCNRNRSNEWRPFEYGGLFNEGNCKTQCCSRTNGVSWEYIGFGGSTTKGSC